MAVFTITDDFSPPSLNNLKWSSELIGSVGMSVGAPTDGVYPLTVDNDGDKVSVLSENKIFVPANHDFEFEIEYHDVYADIIPPVDRSIYLGWRSAIKGAGLSLWGVDVILNVTAGPTYDFQEYTIFNSVQTLTPLIPDPTAGADGAFKIVRSGTDYDIYYYDSGWVLLDTIALGYMGTGFVKFGVIGGSVLSVPVAFPWILEP